MLYCRQVLSKAAGAVRAVVVNAGNANACTGERGLLDAAAMAATAEAQLGLEAGTTLVMSTGIIGRPLPLDKIEKGLIEVAGKFSRSEVGGFSKAIMTTDLVEKTVALKYSHSGKTITIGAAAKGSGMIHPNMATMLAFFTTDANISPEALQDILRRVVSCTFNMVSVDGDRSPNDSAFVLASGGCGAPRIENPESLGWSEFMDALCQAAERLAKMIAADGEGATRLIEIQVSGADSFENADRVARSIANSPLVKTAIFGSDPNWGRIICAAGYSGAPVDPSRLGISIGGISIVEKGEPVAVDQSRLVEALKQKEVTIGVELGQGEQRCRFWTCDFSYDYVRINAEYHT